MSTLTTDEVLYLWTIARPLLRDMTPEEFAADIASGRNNPRFTLTVDAVTIRLDVPEEAIVLRRNLPRTVSRR